MPLNSRPAAGLLFLTLIGVGCADQDSGTVASPDGDPRDYEVWAIDQSDSPGAEYGGMLYVYDALDLEVPDPSSAQPYDRVDLAGAASTVCQESTGANPVRPHMVFFDPSHLYAVISFVASGHVLIMDASTREPITCFRSTNSATGQQAHAAIPSPDGSYVLVANQSGKRLERIDTDFARQEFAYNTDATLDLATCTTPSGAACESADLRPLNWPICPIVDGTGDHAFVTLRGGGLFVVNPRETPMAIVAEYDSATVHGNGCGGIQIGDAMYINSGGSPVNVSGSDPEDPTLYGFDVYRFPVDGYTGDESPDTPAPDVVFSREGPGDSHGMVALGDGDYLWVFDRHTGTAEVVSTANGEHVGTVQLGDPETVAHAPDLADTSPDGSLVFVAMRGPTPLSGDPHNATGEAPGLGIVRVTDGGRGGELLGVTPVSNTDDEGRELADVHSVRVRRR